MKQEMEYETMPMLWRPRLRFAWMALRGKVRMSAVTATRPSLVTARVSWGVGPEAEITEGEDA